MSPLAHKPPDARPSPSHENDLPADIFVEHLQIVIYRDGHLAGQVVGKDLLLNVNSINLVWNEQLDPRLDHMVDRPYDRSTQLEDGHQHIL